MMAREQTQAFGALYYSRCMSPDERRALPPCVDEFDDLTNRVIFVDFNDTLAALQRCILQDMLKMGVDMHVTAREYAVQHNQCSPDVHFRDCQWCRSKGSGHRGVLRSGQQPADTTLTELGLIPGHEVVVALDNSQ